MWPAVDFTAAAAAAAAAASGGVAGQVMCAAHNKMRSSQYCMETYGGWQCRPGYECKCRSPSEQHQVAGSAQCAVHQKGRSLEFLEQREDGLWQCKHGFECKYAGRSDVSMQTCAAHGKMRSTDCLMENSMAQFVCKPGSRCKSSRFLPGGQGLAGVAPIPFVPQSAQASWGQPAASTPAAQGTTSLASLHEAAALQAMYLQHQYAMLGAHQQGGLPVANPGFVGLAAAAAVAGAAQPDLQQMVTCSSHHKRRSVNNMEPHPSIPNAFVCRHGFLCKS